MRQNGAVALRVHAPLLAALQLGMTQPPMAAATRGAGNLVSAVPQRTHILAALVLTPMAAAPRASNPCSRHATSSLS